MELVTVSPKYQVVIPKSIREFMGIESGEKVMMFEKDYVIHMVRMSNIKDLRGKFKNVTTEGVRDEDDRY